VKRVLAILSVIIAAILTGCIRNDVPYPTIVAKITALDVEGAIDVSIDSDTRTVTVTLDETTDIRNVNIRSIEFNSPEVTPSWDVTGKKDLSKGLKVTLQTYSEYVWSIVAEQPIERWFTVSGQVGTTKIDAVNRRAITQVTTATDRASLDITSIKLGPEGITTYSPDPSTIHDFSLGAEIDVTCHGETQTWSLFVEQTETVVEFVSLDAWTRVAWLKGNGIAGKENGFRYRQAGEEQWKEVPDVKMDGGAFSAALDSLAPLTSYECVAYCGEDLSEIISFTTEDEKQVPNNSFEVFTHAESDKFFSFYDPASSDVDLQTKWWGSGNKGSTTVGSSYSISNPDQTDFVDGQASLKMESQYVVVKFAAGNIFSGEYSRTIGTSGGVIRLGRPFTLRPRKVTLWLKYNCGKITEKTLGGYPDNDPVKVGDNDRGTVWVALGDWDYHKYGGSADCPVEVNTTDKNTFFKPDGPNVIAYGNFVTGESIGEWTKVEIPLNYTTTSKRPTHIIISAAASLLGDYFTGSAESVLWIDNVQLEY